MGLQKYRADVAGDVDAGGAVPWYCNWMGGPTLSLIRSCPTPFGPRTVYVRGEADSYFTIPAACQFRGRTIQGYLTYADSGYSFHAHRFDSVYPEVKG